MACPEHRFDARTVGIERVVEALGTVAASK